MNHHRCSGVAAFAGLWFTPRMSLETLTRAIAAPDDGARRELASFLFSLREKQWADASKCEVIPGETKQTKEPVESRGAGDSERLTQKLTRG